MYQLMKHTLLLLMLLISFSGIANPWDKLVNELTRKQTLSELIVAKTKFYSRHDRSPLTRNLDFGIKHTVWEFDFVHGNYSTDFKLTILSSEDSIIFGRLDRLHWNGKIKEKYKFSVKEIELVNLVNGHNDFYSTTYTTDGYVDELIQSYYFSLGCGETGSYLPREAKRMLNWVQSENVKKLNDWLCSPNFELQAYAVEGLTRINEDGKSIPEKLDQTIEHLLDKNSMIINCAGCLMGLETPLYHLIFDYRK
jgi:hypothetical protein